MAITGKDLAKKKKTENRETNLLLYKYCREEWHPIIKHYLQEESYYKNEALFKTGSEVHGMLFIKSGKAKVVSIENGKEKIIRLANEGEIIGHRGFGAPVYPVSAFALSDCEIYFIPKEIFNLLVKSNSDLSFWLINFLAEELRRAEIETRNLVHLTVKQRIAKALLYTADIFGYSDQHSGKLNFTPSRKDIGSMVGTTYETVIRSLTELQDEGLISTSGKEIIIKSQSGLKGLLD
jgi:CRP/FNR family transcriptional regulator, cyclic AMP receptor protein